MERRHARLLEVYLSAVVERDQFESKRWEIQQHLQRLAQELRHLEAQA